MKSQPDKNIHRPARRLTLFRAAMLSAAVFFTWTIVQFHQPGTGFTSLISIGDILDETKVTALREVPHFVYDESAGYDGAYYVQIALHPTLDNPELEKAIDNLPYRARRILFSWVAWVLGLGQPGWIVQAHALLNVLCWFVLAGLLLRWFPPTGWQNLFRWTAILFSHGVCMSVRHSLVDLPSLVLVALAVRWVEEGSRWRGTALLACAGLGRETSLLAAGAIADPAQWRSRAAWGRLVVSLALTALPLTLWIGFIRWKYGPAGDTGLGNFTWPFAGLAEKTGVVIANFDGHPTWRASVVAAAATVAIAVQFAFIVARWRWAETWWRVGAVFAGLMVFLATPVWEGYPGAFPRVLLPMTVAFNILVPRSRRWLPLLVAGNLTVLASWGELTAPARDFFRLDGESPLVSQVEVKPTTGWYGAENEGKDRWRWTSGDAELRIRNATGGSLVVSLRGRISAVENQAVKILSGGTEIWNGETAAEATSFAVQQVLPPGDTVLRFAGGRPARTVGEDPRLLALSVYNLEMVVNRPSVAP